METIYCPVLQNVYGGQLDYFPLHLLLVLQFPPEDFKMLLRADCHCPVPAEKETEAEENRVTFTEVTLEITAELSQAQIRLPSTMGLALS